MFALLVAASVSDPTQIPIAFKDHGWQFGMNLPSLAIVAVVCSLFVVLVFFCERAYSNTKPHAAEPVPPMLMPQELRQHDPIGVAFAPERSYRNQGRSPSQL
jgi:hypothetical protein